MVTIGNPHLRFAFPDIAPSRYHFLPSSAFDPRQLVIIYRLTLPRCPDFGIERDAVARQKWFLLSATRFANSANTGEALRPWSDI